MVRFFVPLSGIAVATAVAGTALGEPQFYGGVSVSSFSPFGTYNIRELPDHKFDSTISGISLHYGVDTPLAHTPFYGGVELIAERYFGQTELQRPLDRIVEASPEFVLDLRLRASSKLRDNWFTYAAGGVSVMQVSYYWPEAEQTLSRRSIGPVVALGIERKISENWRWRSEVSYTWQEKESYFFESVNEQPTNRILQTDLEVFRAKVGVTYLFD